MQGTIPYFGNYPLYNVYTAGSILLIVILIAIPTIILMLYPFISNIVIIFRWEESRGIQFVNKCLLVHVLKPILDSFQGDYKDHLRFLLDYIFFVQNSLFLHCHDRINTRYKNFTILNDHLLLPAHTCACIGNALQEGRG